MSINDAAGETKAMKNKVKPNQPPKQESTPRVLRRYINRREATEAAARFYIINGRNYVVRFSLGQRIEHYILLITFSLLGITGLAQTFSNTSIGYFILTTLGGIDSTRVIHHTAAFIFGTLAIYHVAKFLYLFFMGHRIPKMLPEWSDVEQFLQMVKLDLGLSSRHPWFDRYNFEEKVEYWALVWGTIVMGMTGLMQWFPIAATYYLPGGVIPVARAFHKWEAILAVLAVLIWHTYHSVIKKRNTSIFSGLMSIEDMEEEHPQELAYLRAAAAVANNRSWPVMIEIPLEEEKAPEPVSLPPAEEKKAPETANLPVEEKKVPEPVSPPVEENPKDIADPKAAGEEE